MKQRICIFTGSRADYGLLVPLLELLQKDPDIELQTLVSGMHLSPEFGQTYREIEKDGFPVTERVEMLLSSDTSHGICTSMGIGLSGFSSALARLKPDILVILGDRFEALAAAIAATISRIPIAHLHGGEATQGLIDEPIRHSITKMSHLHFVATDTYRNRVIQLGEDPSTVFNVGAIGLENLKRLALLDKSALEDALNFRFGKHNALVTFHPVTLEDASATEQFNCLLSALKKVKDIHVIFTKTNADTDGREINRLIDNFVAAYQDTTVAFESMGQLRYLSTMKLVDVVIGNSSSGILEAPSLGTPTINIGDRQKGRVKAECVLDCAPQVNEISKTIQAVLAKKLKIFSKSVENPYEGQDTAEKIKEILKTARHINLKKSFYDLPANSLREHHEKCTQNNHISEGHDQRGD